MSIHRNERALVVVSQLAYGMPAEFQWLYQFIQNSGRVVVQTLLGPAYGDFRELYDTAATDINLLNTLQVCGADPNIKAIDLIIMLHGSNDILVFYNNSVGMGNFATQIANLNLRGKLRLVYSLACYGDSHSDDFVSGGFASSIGAVGVNANASVEFPTFLTNWALGWRLKDVLNLAESPITRIPADLSAKAFGSLARLGWAPDVNSDKELRGDQNITINSALDPSYLTPGDIESQSDWRWCHKCQGLFFSGGQSSAGNCPAGGQHEKTVSGNYTLAHNSLVAIGQPDWRWCHKCQGLFFSGGQSSVGNCPAGGEHEKTVSGNYTLAHNSVAIGQPDITRYQSDWRWCHKCQGLFFSGGQSSVGNCPAGGQHEKTVSGDYTLAHTPNP
jgi:hypothetical protein